MLEPCEGKLSCTVLRGESGSNTADLLDHWTEGKVICETGKTNSALSDRISEDLKKRGMKFVGTTVVYAYLQAVGVVWGHEENCFLSLHQGKNMQKK